MERKACQTNYFQYGRFVPDATSAAEEIDLRSTVDHSVDVAHPLVPRPDVGRSFTGRRIVRLGDVDRGGRLRLDALTRYTQDVSDDDTTDAGLPDAPGWVVRSTVVDELVAATLGETLTVVTFCSGLGTRWAERRLSVSGDSAARYEVATLWVCIDPVTGRPQPLTDQFISLFGGAAAGRRVPARQRNPKPTDAATWDTARHRWQLRAADYDVFDHVNNAAYWQAVEQWLPSASGSTPRRARLEYGPGLAPAETVEIELAAADGALVLWWFESGPDGEPSGANPAATAAVAPLPASTYPNGADRGG